MLSSTTYLLAALISPEGRRPWQCQTAKRPDVPNIISDRKLVLTPGEHPCDLKPVVISLDLPSGTPGWLKHALAPLRSVLILLGLWNVSLPTSHDCICAALDGPWLPSESHPGRASDLRFVFYLRPLFWRSLCPKQNGFALGQV